MRTRPNERGRCRRRTTMAGSVPGGGHRKVTVDAKDLKKLPRITLDVKDTTVEHVLALVFVPRGRKLVLDGKGLKVAVGS